MFALVALASAVVYGAADFIGGFASRRASTIAVVVLSQLAGLLLLAIALPLLPASDPAPSDFVWGAAAGLTGGTGVALLYRALAVGTMAVVAPVTAVSGVALPVIVAIAFGERPAPLALAGIGIALIAIALVSQQQAGSTGSETTPRTSGIGLALASGLAIGLFYLSLARTGAGAGVWPLVAARIASVALFGTIAVAAARSLRMPRGVVAIAAAGGGLDMLANFLYLVATRNGPLALAVTLSSLYPASTVLLARIVLKERLNTPQAVGVLCALAAVALIVFAGNR